jgi:hypothetical protein
MFGGGEAEHEGSEGKLVFQVKMAEDYIGSKTRASLECRVITHLVCMPLFLFYNSLNQ